MISGFKNIHTKFRLNGIPYNRNTLKALAYGFVKEGESFEKSAGNFLLNWLDDSDTISVKTSGSTGRPKSIQLKKQGMVNSAIATGAYFNLKPNDKALLCLSSNFIAGKMMLVRAMVLGLQLDLVAPSSNPLNGLKEDYDFSAMVPMQVENSLSQLDQIKTVIIGGAPVSSNLIEKLQGLETKAYATYGMTETITHIAVKNLNYKKNVILSGAVGPLFKTLPNVTISQDHRNCLIIEAPHLFDGNVITNDIVKLHSKSSFEFLGRYDNAINSGGVKLFPEVIEEKLSSVIHQRFFISSETDALLGERVVLIIEGLRNSLPPSAFDVLNSYEKPKATYAVSKFVETSSGKIKRKDTLDLVIKG